MKDFLTRFDAQNSDILSYIKIEKNSKTLIIKTKNIPYVKRINFELEDEINFNLIIDSNRGDSSILIDNKGKSIDFLNKTLSRMKFTSSASYTKNINIDVIFKNISGDFSVKQLQFNDMSNLKFERIKFIDCDVTDLTPPISTMYSRLYNFSLISINKTRQLDTKFTDFEVTADNFEMLFENYIINDLIFPSENRTGRTLLLNDVKLTGLIGCADYFYTYKFSNVITEKEFDITKFYPKVTTGNKKDDYFTGLRLFLTSMPLSAIKIDFNQVSKILNDRDLFSFKFTNCNVEDIILENLPEEKDTRRLHQIDIEIENNNVILKNKEWFEDGLLKVSADTQIEGYESINKLISMVNNSDFDYFVFHGKKTFGCHYQNNKKNMIYIGDFDFGYSNRDYIVAKEKFQNINIFKNKSVKDIGIRLYKQFSGKLPSKTREFFNKQSKPAFHVIVGGGEFCAELEYSLKISFLDDVKNNMDEDSLFKGGSKDLLKIGYFNQYLFFKNKVLANAFYISKFDEYAILQKDSKYLSTTIWGDFFHSSYIVSTYLPASPVSLSSKAMNGKSQNVYYFMEFKHEFTDDVRTFLSASMYS